MALIVTKTTKRHEKYIYAVFCQSKYLGPYYQNINATVSISPPPKEVTDTVRFFYGGIDTELVPLVHLMASAIKLYLWIVDKKARQVLKKVET